MQVWREQFQHFAGYYLNILSISAYQLKHLK